jgi:antitoxin component of MazEF toxin-antitoxin module
MENIKYIGRVKVTGSSLYVIIPKNMVDYLEIKENDFVSVVIEKQDKKEEE